MTAYSKLRAIFSLAICAIVHNCNTAVSDEQSRGCQLLLACHDLDPERVVVALREGANVDFRLDAIGIRNKQIQERFLELGYTPLLTFVRSRRFVHPSNGTINSDGSDSNRSRDLEMTIFWILLSNKCDIDIKDLRGASALYYAIENRNVEVAKILLRLGADVNFHVQAVLDGTGGRTPLHAAYWSDELYKLLVASSADVNAVDAEGVSASQLRQEHLRIVDDPFSSKNR